MTTGSVVVTVLPLVHDFIPDQLQLHLCLPLPLSSVQDGMYTTGKAHPSLKDFPNVTRETVPTQGNDTTITAATNDNKGQDFLA